MKNFKKNGIALLMVLVLVLSPMKVFAAELPTEAVYDLEKGGTQTFLIRDENGEIGEVTIEEVTGNARIADGTYKVTYEQPASWRAGFHLSITNNKFNSAFTPFYSVAVGSVLDDYLTKDSWTKATYSILLRQFSIIYNTGVVATMSGTELVVTRK